MNSPSYVIVFVLVIFWLIYWKRRQIVVARRAVPKRKSEGNAEMKELAKRFIGKESIITTFDMNHGFDGIIREVTDGAILIEKGGRLEAINLDFVIRIREYPRKKKGEK